MVLSICCPELHFVDLRVLQSLYFLLNSMSSFTADSMCMGEGPSTWVPIFENNECSPSARIQQLPMAPQFGMRLCETLPIHAMIYMDCYNENLVYTVSNAPNGPVIFTPHFECVVCGHVTHSVLVLGICYISS